MASPGRRRSRAGLQALERLTVLAAVVVATCVVPRVLAQDAQPPPGDPQPPPAAEAVPGAASAVEAEGWGGRVAAVTYVEGAAAGAPLRLADKPRPQHDWYVQEFPGARPPSLNVYVTPEPGAAAIARPILDRLIEVDPDSPPQIVPALAVSWEVTDGGRTCTYKLRKGVQFADGRPFTSADVAFSFAVVRDPAVTADHLRPDLEAIETLTTPDEHTVVAHYKTPSWRAVYVLGNYLRILNKGWYEEEIPKRAKAVNLETFSTTPGEPGFGGSFNGIADPCPGTGPYYLRAVEDAPSTHVHLVQNPFSWRTQLHPSRNNFAGVRWIETGDETSEYHAFVNQQIDVWVVPHAFWENQLSRDVPTDAVGQHFVYDHIGLDCSLIGWNCRKAPFDDPLVRRAMTHLLDREWLLWRLDEGHGRIATCRSKPSYPSYSNFIDPHAFSPSTAKVLLRRAGWTDEDGDGIIEKKGKEFEFDLLIPSGREYFVILAGRLQHECRKVGIDMAVRAVEPSGFLRQLRSQQFQAVAGYSSWPDPWIDLYTSYHSSNDVRNGSNLSGWRNAEVDELLEAMRQELDEDERVKLHHRFNRIYHEEQPESLLVHGKVGVLVNKRFEGVSVRPTGLQHFDLWVRPENVLHGPAAGADDLRPR